MLHSFRELLDRASSGPKHRLCVAAAADKEVLETVKMAETMGFASAVLVGDEQKIAPLATAVGLNEHIIIHCPEVEQTANKAVEALKAGQADVLMKGKIGTPTYMRAILNSATGIRAGGLLSALAIYEMAAYHKLIFCSDSGINVAPNQEQKKKILHNALQAMNKLGVTNPRVAVLAASETVDPKVQTSVDAVELVAMVQRGETPPCIIEGPIAFDVAFSQAAAKSKGITSAISGEVDLILAPNIETGNALGKSWLTFNQAKWAGVVLGATHPVVLGSRSDTPEVKINSVAMACLLAKQ